MTSLLENWGEAGSCRVPDRMLGKQWQKRAGCSLLDLYPMLGLVGGALHTDLILRTYLCGPSYFLNPHCTSGLESLNNEPPVAQLGSR